jgi:hypothetical protein
MSLNCEDLDYCLEDIRKLERGSCPIKCFKCMSELLLPSEKERIQRINNNRYLYHGTDPDSLRKIQKDGFLKPKSKTHNENYGVSYEDSIYFEFKQNEVFNWTLCLNPVVIRVKKAFVPKCFESDDISSGIRVITDRIGFLEVSLNRGRSWTKIPMKEE